MRISLGLRAAAAGLFAISMVGAGCGSDGDDEADTAPTGAEGGTSAAASGGDEQAEGVVLGYRVTGDPGSQVEVRYTAVSDGVEQQPQTQTTTLGDEPFALLFTVFVDAVEMEITVVEGGPVTLEGVRGRSVDPDNPIGEVEVTEVLAEVDASTDSPGTVEIP
ncbi:MAG: hypothetical protein ACSLFP_02855 [Acidimicrobiales bacterium]